MKNLLILLFLFPVIVFGQVIPQNQPTQMPYYRGGFAVARQLVIPRDTTTTFPDSLKAGSIGMKNGIPYYNNGTVWQSFLSGGGGANNYPTSLSFSTGTRNLTLGRNGLSSLVANIPSDTVGIAAAIGLKYDASNPAGYITSVPAQAWISITGKPSFALVATSGLYSDLAGLPTIPTNTNQLTNGSGFITSVPAQSFASLTGKPTILSGYGITDAYPLTGNPSGFISSVPAQSWTSITGKPSFATVATTGAYGDLTGTPTIPTNNNQLTNGNAYISNVTGLVTQGSNITITGLGTSGSPYVVNAAGSSGTVTSASVVSANGFAGTVATSTTTPAITLSTSVTGIIKGNGTAISAATAGTDYQAPITFSTTSGTGNATFASNALNIPPAINNQSSSQTASFNITGTMRAGSSGSGPILVGGASSAGTGNNSFAIGAGASIGGSAHAGALLRGATANGDDAFAIGINANASTAQAFAIGILATANSTNSLSLGLGASARSYQETAIGNYNTNYTASSTGSYNSADPIFTIGVGEGTGTLTRANALTISKNTNRTVQIGVTTAKPTYEATAALEVVSTTGFFYPPKMTGAQATAISSPADGAMFYCTDTATSPFTTKGLWARVNGSWLLQQ